MLLPAHWTRVFVSGIAPAATSSSVLRVSPATKTVSTRLPSPQEVMSWLVEVWTRRSRCGSLVRLEVWARLAKTANVFAHSKATRYVLLISLENAKLMRGTGLCALSVPHPVRRLGHVGLQGSRSPILGSKHRQCCHDASRPQEFCHFGCSLPYRTYVCHWLWRHEGPNLVLRAISLISERRSQPPSNLSQMAHVSLSTEGLGWGWYHSIEHNCSNSEISEMNG